MRLRTFPTAPAFLERAAAFLLQHEAAHCLPLGLATALSQKPDLYAAPYFAVVESAAGEVVTTALMTPPHYLILTQCTDPAALELVAQDLRTRRPTLPGVSGPQPQSLAFAAQWQRLTGRAFKLEVAERVYQLTHVHPVPDVPGAKRWLRASDETLLRDWLRAFHAEAMGAVDDAQIERTVQGMLALPPTLRGTFLWEVAGEPVALTSYGGPTPNGIRIGPVYTPPAHRRRGYATALVAQVSQHLLDGGRQFVFLFTNLANPTSNHIYQEIGYTPAMDVDVYKFELPT